MWRQNIQWLPIFWQKLRTDDYDNTTSNKDIVKDVFGRSGTTLAAWQRTLFYSHKHTQVIRTLAFRTSDENNNNLVNYFTFLTVVVLISAWLNSVVAWQGRIFHRFFCVKPASQFAYGFLHTTYLAVGWSNFQLEFVCWGVEIIFKAPLYFVYLPLIW